MKTPVLITIDERKLPKKIKRSHRVMVKLDHVNKGFRVGKKRRLKVLKKIDLNLYRGEFVIIFGPSGCGKSTLLHTMLGLETPEKGKVYLMRRCLNWLSEDERAIWRRQHVGIVFQQSNWVRSLTVVENVSYPLYLTGLDEAEIRGKAMEQLRLVGMDYVADKKPMELSGGEQQKVALARALITDPDVIIADEPTGNLDSKSSSELITLLIKLNREMRKSVIMVTHDAQFLPFATRRVIMKDGRIVEDENEE